MCGDRASPDLSEFGFPYQLIVFTRKLLAFEMNCYTRILLKRVGKTK